jgi:hypothetical protein
VLGTVDEVDELADEEEPAGPVNGALKGKSKRPHSKSRARSNVGQTGGASNASNALDEVNELAVHEGERPAAANGALKGKSKQPRSKRGVRNNEGRAEEVDECEGDKERNTVNSTAEMAVDGARDDEGDGPDQPAVGQLQPVSFPWPLSPTFAHLFSRRNFFRPLTKMSPHHEIRAVLEGPRPLNFCCKGEFKKRPVCSLSLT